MAEGDFRKALMWMLVICNFLMEYMCDECPLGCSCSSVEGNGTGTQLVSCIGVFPQRVPRTIDELVITDANVSSLTAHNLTSLGKLSSLYIISSCISWIAEDAFGGDSVANLKDLRLSDNEINLLGIRTFGNLSEIEELFLDGNNLRTVHGVLPHLKTLEVLHLENNYLEEVPNDLPLSLKKLFLNNNNIHIVNFVGISYTSLKHLDLCENSFAGLSRQNISIPEGLENLCLGNQFYDIDPKIFSAKRSSLKSLVLKTTKKLTRYTLDAINIFHELKELTISGAKVYKLPGWAFRILPKLESLSLTNMKCSPSIDDNFFSFELLTDLNLSGSPDITKTVLNNQVFLENAPYLRSLKLRETSISDISDDMMPVLQRLEQLDISNNRLTCDCNLYNIMQNSRRGKLILISPEQTRCFSESAQTTYLILDKRLRFNCNETKNGKPRSFEEGDDTSSMNNEGSTTKAPNLPDPSTMNGLHYTIICLILLVTVLLVIIFCLLVKYLKVLRWKRCTVSTIF